MAGGSPDIAVEPPPQIQKQPLPQHDGSLPASMKSAPTAVAANTTENVTLSLSDYLAEVAAEHSLVFRPKKALHLGKQVYQFGGVSICLDRNAVYVATSKGQDIDWQLASMERLLALAKASKSTERKGSG